MRVVSLRHASPGMKLGVPLRGGAGRVLLARGVSLTNAYLERIHDLGVPAVYIDDDETAGIEPPDPVPPAFRQKVIGDLSCAFSAVGRSGTLRAAVADPATGKGRGGGDDGVEKVVFGGSLGGSVEGIHAMADNVDGLLDQLVDQEVLLGLNSIKSHDDYTFQHSIDVTIAGVLLARRAGWDRQRVRTFAIGCLLHDIGKVFVEPAILNKNGPLTNEEFARMKSHPLLGYQTIKAIAPGMGLLVPQVAYQHHERQDGSGYPHGLKGGNTLGRHRDVDGGDQIHEFGALCAVSDVYDALTSDRPYRESYTPDRVLDAITRMAGTHLNAEAVAILRKVVAPYPVCCEVRVLNGKYAGYRGVVAKVPPGELDRPLVRLLFDAAGARIDAREIDLQVERDVRLGGSRGGRPDDRVIADRPRPVAAPAAPLPAEVQDTLRKLNVTSGAPA